MSECQKIPKNTISQDVSPFIVAKTTGTSEKKGSNWVHSLPQALLSAEADDSSRRRKIRNILPGGLAEQMLKLQRREKSERVIWKHKAEESKKKALTNFLHLVIKSVSYMADTVMLKCLCISASSVPENAIRTSCVLPSLSPESSLPDGQVHGLVSDGSTSHVIVLFKKSTFTKLCMSARDAFHLYPPWQTLHVRSIPCPIIVCAYFVETAVHPHITPQNETVEDMKLSEDLGISSTTVNTPRVSSMDALLFGQGPGTLSARVHRVWCSEASLEKFSIFKTANKHFRYSVLLQTEDGTFHEVMLKFGSDPVPNAWKNFFSSSEGRCYMFRNLQPSHKLHIKRHKDFFRILNSLSMQQHGQIGKELKQDFFYQLMLTCISEVPQEISEEAFPRFCPIHIQPLSQLYKSEAVVHRVSCMGKVFLKCKKSLYISDESLCHSELLRYMEVQFLSSAPEDTVQIGTVVLIKEALLQEDFLLLDHYSQLQPLFESSNDCTELGLHNRLKKIALLQLQNAIQPLNPSSEVNHLVSIKGDVASVDENKAFTWLQCSFCLQENLIQDTNLVIYCEDCCQVVPKPVLNVKMEVTIHCPNMPAALVNVQLLSTTIREILQIDDNTYQPQCSVGDVLGKTIGPLYCFIRNCEIIHDQQIFYLSELNSNWA